MLFYVKGGPKEGGTQPPQEKILETVVKEWEAVIKMCQEGKILASYGFIDGKGGFSIFKVDSREELDILVSKLPMHPYAEFEIIQLITDEEALDQTKQAIASMKG